MRLPKKDTPLEKIFPPLEQLKNQFYEKNGLTLPKRVIPISNGMILRNGEKTNLILTRENLGGLDLFERPQLLPGPTKEDFAQHRTIRMVNYCMEGEIRGTPLYLEARIEYIEKFGGKWSSDFSLSWGEQTSNRTNPVSLTITRKDPESYWFLT